MIINRYIQRNIHLGTAGALLLLVSLALFFTFVRELDNIGEGAYDIGQVLRYLVLSVPGRIVEFLPLAVLLGSMLSLGAMANNSELIAMQASGITLPRMIGAVLQAALLVAVISFLLADWVVPDSETSARKVRELRKQDTASIETSQGVWLKDESRIVHVHELYPGGLAQRIEIYQLDPQGGLQALIRAERAQPVEGGWELFEVDRTELNEGGASSQYLERLVYPGDISEDLLKVLLVEPRQMSSRDLYAYLRFLDENRLDARVERLIFWQKIFAPVTIIIMCLLAFPFVLGSQRHSNTGHRLLVGILLGLSFVVVDRVLTQLGTQYAINGFIIAITPNLMFLALALYLLFGRGEQSLRLFRRRHQDDARAAEAVVPGPGSEQSPQVTEPEAGPRQ